MKYYVSSLPPLGVLLFGAAIGSISIGSIVYVLLRIFLSLVFISSLNSQLKLVIQIVLAKQKL
jgi:hypothetical protein